jgi:hypothetical protein
VPCRQTKTRIQQKQENRETHQPGIVKNMQRKKKLKQSAPRKIKPDIKLRTGFSTPLGLGCSTTIISVAEHCVGILVTRNPHPAFLPHWYASIQGANV